jgi:predicted dehydrogenase
LGGIGQRHARNLRSILGDRLELLAYRVRGLSHVVTAKLEADATRNVEAAHGIRAIPDLDAALAERPEIAFICNPSSMHVATAAACLNAGCDVFIEKPLSDSLEGVDALIRAADERHRIAMVGYQLRFHPCLRKLASVIESGVLGHILSVRAVVGEYLPNWHPYEDYRQGYAARTNLGGGVILTQIHEFDYLCSLFGLPRKVYAIGGHWSDLEIDAEDTASVLMEASMEGRPLPIHLHQDYLQSPSSRSCEVIGDRGKAVMDLGSLTVAVQDARSSTPAVDTFPEFERNQLFLDELRHFLTCLEKRTSPVVDLRDGAQSLRMALAAKQSILTGMPTALSAQTGELARV